MPPAAPRRRGLVTSVVIVLLITIGSLGATLAAGWSPRLGLDLAGGLSVVYKPATTATVSTLDVAANIISDRVNGLGVSGAEVTVQQGVGGNNIVVSVPGIKNAQAVLKEIGQTAQLFFRPVLCETLPATKGAKPFTAATVYPKCTAASELTAANLQVTPANNTQGFTTANVPLDTAYTSYQSTPADDDTMSRTVLLPLLGGGGVRYLLGPAELTGTIVTNAQAVVDSLGQWVVEYNFTSAGGPKWDAMAQKYFHAMIAIDLDGVIQSAPIIEPTQTSFSSFLSGGGTPTISGDFGEGSAKSLALALQYGALPVRLNELDTQTISPTLGHDSLIAGLGAGIVGLILVLLYGVAYYRGLGLVILLGLSITGGLLWAIISALGHTSIAPSFDLSGVTGLIVSIGITVDSYIVYFERLKDETRAGRTVRTSVDRGFKSAWKTVRAADFVTLLAAVLLFVIAVGTVKGFAFFLGISTIMDLVITWYFTRPLVMLLGRRVSGKTSALSIAAGAGVTASPTQSLAGAAND